MKKIMKKFIKGFFKGLAIFIGIVIIALIVVPMFFKDDLLLKVKQEINNNVNAKVEFNDFRLSLIKSFPNLNIGLYDLSVIGVDKFQDDTLMYFNSFNVQVNLFSAIKKNIKVKGIVLDEPYINAVVLADSSANWDIAIPAELDTTIVQEEPLEPGDESEPIDYRVALKKFQIKDAVIKYTDETSGMVASLENLNFLLKGDFGMDYSDLSLITSIEAINVKMGLIRYLKDTYFGFDATIGADMENMKFTFKDNLFSINDIVLAFDGAVEMPGDDINIDLNFGTKKTSFKSLLSMVPAIYMEGFEELKTAGNLQLKGDLKGTYNDSLMPSANINLIVENAMFQYPDLPKSVDNINIDLAVFYDGVVNDNTRIDLNKFHVELAGNPFDIAMHLRTPFSDPSIKGAVDAHLVFSTLSDALPMEDVNMDGEFIADIDMEGNMSSIENEKYEDFKALGKLQIKDFTLSSADLPAEVKIIETIFNFSSQYLELQSFKSEIGESDFNLNGKIENYIPYALSDGVLKGNFNFTSSNINVNEFMSDSDESVEEIEEDPLADTSAMGVIEVPANIDFKLASKLDHIIYDQMDITDLNGTFIIKDQKVLMDNLNMKLLDGSLGVDGEYNTQNIESPQVKMGLDIRDIEIESALESFSMLETLAPILKHCKGKISLKFNYTSLIDSSMSPILNSIDGYGRLTSKSIQVVDSKTLNQITSLIKLGDDHSNEFKDVNVSFTVKDGRISVEPFDVKMGDINMNVGGSHGIDQTLDYDLKIDVPREYFGSAANDALESLLGEAAKAGVKLDVSDVIKVKAKVVGTTTDPKVSLNYKDDSGDTDQGIKEQLKDKAEDEARAELEAQAQKVVDDAEAEAEKLKKEAREQADKILKDANEEADKLVAKASKEGYVAKIAAEKAADELKKEAKNKADKLVAEADKKADALVEEAQVKADNIRKEN